MDEPDELFVDDASESDVTLTSTVASEGTIYRVDRILAEEVRLWSDDEDDSKPIKKYLVRWYGYKVEESTWEPEAHFDTGEALLEWEQRKAQENAGLKEPFDVSAFRRRKTEFDQETGRRRERRRIKREEIESEKQRARNPRTTRKSIPARRKIPVSHMKQQNTSLLSDSPDATSFAMGGARKRKRTTAVTPSPSASSMDVPVASQESFDSLFDTTPGNRPEMPTKSSSRDPCSSDGLSLSATPPQPTATATNMISPPERVSTILSTATTARADLDLNEGDSHEHPKSQNLTSLSSYAAQKACQNPDPVKPLTASASHPEEPSVVTKGDRNAGIPLQPKKITLQQAISKKKARQAMESDNTLLQTSKPTQSVNASESTKTSKVRPAVAGASTTAKRAPLSIFSNWDKPKKKDVRKSRLDNSISMDNGARFKGLSIQNRVSKWANTERAPDPNALRDIDPHTGKLDEPRPGPETPRPTTSSTLRIDTNVGQQQRVPDPASAGFFATGSRSSNAATAALSATPYHASPDMYSKKSFTCSFWKRGKCKYAERDCEFSHAETPHGLLKRNETCHFWATQGCQWDDNDCFYLHSNPGEANHKNARQGSVRGSLFERQYGCRDEIPDRSGLRQVDLIRLEELEKAGNGSAVPKPPATDQGAAIAGSETSTRPIDVGQASLPSNVSPHGRDVYRISDGGDFQHVMDTSLPEHGGLGPADIDIDPLPPARVITASLRVASQSTEGTVLQVQLSLDANYDQLGVIGALGDNIKLEILSICLAKDFQEFCFEAEQSLAAGNVAGLTEAPGIESLAEYLIINGAGAVVQNRGYVIIFYPTMTDSWKFLESRKRSGQSEAALRFYVQSSPGQNYETSHDKAYPPGGSAVAAICEEHFDLDKRRIFEGSKKAQLDRTVFLMFPSRLMPEAQVISTWLLERNATVYYADIPGSWEQFRENRKDFSKSGVILFHPSMDQYHQIPYFSWILFTGNYNLFQLEIEPGLNCPPDADTKPSCVRLFPHGSAKLITDDVFEHHPRAAADALEIAAADAKRRGDGVTLDRVLARPGLEDWLDDLVDKYGEQDMAVGNTDRLRLCHVVSGLICRDEDIPMDRTDSSLIMSPSLADLPDYPRHWDQDEESATDWLVEWFAGWCSMEREHYRRFQVIHEQYRRPEHTPGTGMQKDPRGWSKRFRHIKVVNCRLYKSMLEGRR